MILRNVEPGAAAVDLYTRMRCDPAMMDELGGPLLREGIADKVARDAKAAAEDTSWIKLIVPDEARPDCFAGSVMLWRDEEDGEPVSEIGWMVVPEFQGRGLGRQAVAQLLGLARADGRWGAIHAYPGVTNAPSNGICRSLGFTLLGQAEVTFADRLLHTNHWVLAAG